MVRCCFINQYIFFIKKSEGREDMTNSVFSLLTSWEVAAVGWSQAIEVNNNDLCKIKQILQVSPELRFHRIK